MVARSVEGGVVVVVVVVTSAGVAESAAGRHAVAANATNVAAPSAASDRLSARREDAREGTMRSSAATGRHLSPVISTRRQLRLGGPTPRPEPGGRAGRGPRPGGAPALAPRSRRRRRVIAAPTGG